jgi:hypothetical protein
MSWVEDELAGLDLGDVRRFKRLDRVMTAMSHDSEGSLPKISNGWAETKATYRLLSNKALDWRKVLDAHAHSARQRCVGQPVVLCVQDTTELDFSSKPGIAGLGRLSYEAQHGMYVHPTLLVTPQRVTLGVADAWMWARTAKGEPDIKESVRWLEGYGNVADMAADNPETRYVYVADRESDIRSLMDLAEQRDYAADFLIRASHDRNMEGGGKLWSSLTAENSVGTISFKLPEAKGRKERMVTQSLYARRVTLPATSKDGKTLTVTALLAREENPPAGSKPVVWKLLTNRSVSCFADAVELIQWYRCRWQIEVFFHVLKSGCQIESLQLGTMERLERALILYMIIAWRILFLVTWGRDRPEEPCDVFFAQEEWQVIWWATGGNKASPGLPTALPTLGEMVRRVARLGGFLGRKSDGAPGPGVLWRGLLVAAQYAVGVKIAQNMNNNAPTNCG